MSDSAVPGRHLWLAIHGSHVARFAATGPSRDMEANAETAELLALYLEPESVGTGIGRRLCAHAEEHLQRAGFREATLWVLESNTRARRFYGRCGWRVDGVEQVLDLGGQAVREVRYRKVFQA